MEQCYGCDADAKEQHPVIGVINKKELDTAVAFIANPKGTNAKGEDGEHYVGVPVCKACHEDPAHRTVRSLKCHFFYRTDKDAVLVALIRAGSLNLG